MKDVMTEQPSSTEQADDPYVSPPVQRAARLLRHIAEGDAVTNISRTAPATNSTAMPRPEWT